MDVTRRGFIGLAAMGAVVLTTKPSAAGPKAELWDRWTQRAPSSSLKVDNTLWQKFLDARLKNNPAGLNTVDYAGASPPKNENMSMTTLRFSAGPRSQSLILRNKKRIGSISITR